MSLAQNHRVIFMEIYFAVRSYNRCVELSIDKFPHASIPGKSTVYDLCYTGSVNDRQRYQQLSVSMPEFIVNVQLIKTSYSISRRVTKRLALLTYQARGVHELCPLDGKKTHSYYDCFKKFNFNDENNQTNNTLFSDDLVLFKCLH